MNCFLSKQSEITVKASKTIQVSERSLGNQLMEYLLLLTLLLHIQRSATRFIFTDYQRETSITELINNLGWETLHVRRLLAQSNMFFKIHHGLVNIQTPPSIKLATYIGRQDHTLKYIPYQMPQSTNTNSHSIYEQLRSGTIYPLQQSMRHPSQLSNMLPYQQLESYDLWLFLG